MFFFLIFPGTVRTEEEDQVGPQAPEDPHDSSTDSCLTFPYSSNSPRPFPPSPVHPVTDSPIRVSPLLIATSNPSSDNSAIHSPIGHNFPTPALSTPPVMILHYNTTLTPNSKAIYSGTKYYDTHIEFHSLFLDVSSTDVYLELNS